MTTVVYRDGVLAGDSRIVSDGMVHSDNVRKVHRLRSGQLFGWAGSVEDAHRLRLAIAQSKAIGNLDVIAILVEADGTVGIFEGNAWRTEKEPYFAIGSGAPYATGAMDAGANAVTAAAIGAKRDTQSGGKIKSVRFK